MIASWVLAFENIAITNTFDTVKCNPFWSVAQCIESQNHVYNPGSKWKLSVDVYVRHRRWTNRLMPWTSDRLWHFSICSCLRNRVCFWELHAQFKSCLGTRETRQGDSTSSWSVKSRNSYFILLLMLHWNTMPAIAIQTAQIPKWLRSLWLSACWEHADIFWNRSLGETELLNWQRLSGWCEMVGMIEVDSGGILLTYIMRYNTSIYHIPYII